jgi:hypothetical protein
MRSRSPPSVLTFIANPAASRSEARQPESPRSSADPLISNPNRSMCVSAFGRPPGRVARTVAASSENPKKWVALSAPGGFQLLALTRANPSPSLWRHSPPLSPALAPGDVRGRGLRRRRVPRVTRGLARDRGKRERIQLSDASIHAFPIACTLFSARENEPTSALENGSTSRSSTR